MRVLFVAHGPAHTPWLIPLAWACQLAGHEVRIAARPDCLDRVTGAGLIGVGVGNVDTVGKAVTKAVPFGSVAIPVGTEPPQLDEGFAAALCDKMIDVADALTDDLVRFARRWRPEVIVADTAAVAGIVAGAVIGVPVLGHTWGAPLGVTFTEEESLPRNYLALFERFAVSPTPGPSAWIDPCPVSLRPEHPIPRIDMRFVPYTGAAVMPEWLIGQPAKPRVCVTGGVTNMAMHSQLSELLTELGTLDIDVVLAVTAHTANSLGELPANTRLAEQFPLAALLPSCNAIIHQGGMGSGMVSLRLGVPQIVLPVNPLQHYWGALMEFRGCGTRATSDTAAESLIEIIADDRYQQDALAIGKEMDSMPSPDETVRLLEKLAIR